MLYFSPLPLVVWTARLLDCFVSRWRFTSIGVELSLVCIDAGYWGGHGASSVWKSTLDPEGG